MSSEQSSLHSEQTRVRSKSSRRSRRRRSRRRRSAMRSFFRPIYILYLAVPLVLLVMVFAVLVNNAINDVEAAQADLETVLQTIENKDATELTLADYDQIDSSLGQFINAIADAETLTLPARPFSTFDSDVKAQFDLIDAARETAIGTRAFLNGMRPTLVLLERGGLVESASDGSTPAAIGSTGERTVELMAAARSRFATASNNFAEAENILDGIERSGVSQDLLVSIQDITDLHNQMQTYNELALNAPEMLTLLLGLDESQTYLVLAQNNDEIRPSGGYISTWGWMQVRNGDVQDYDYFPTTVETPDPPQEDALDIDIPEWWFYPDSVFAAWDGSWYADFRRTAALNTEYYNNGNNPNRPVDGVIGIDIVAVQYVVAALGDIPVPAFDDVVNGANFRDRIYSVRAAGEGLEHKAYLADMYGQVLEAWRAATPEQKADVHRALLQAIRERHIVLYFESPVLQDAVEELGWSGQLDVQTGRDYLMVADANIGSKSSGAVRRQITYDVTLQANGDVESRMSLDYDFSASVAEADPAVAPEHYGTQRDYFTRLQTIVPHNSELIESEGFRRDLVIDETEDYRIFTGQVVVLYDDSERVQFVYRQPDLVQSLGDYQRYELYLQKQIGSRGDRVTVTIFFPPDTDVLTASPAPTQEYELDGLVYEYTLTLDESQYIDIIFTD
jgi:hypothetical protein